MAWRLGWKIVEVPITFEDRHAGISKMSGRIVREAIWRVPWMALRDAVAACRRRKGKPVMSLTTVAAPVQPDHDAAHLPPSRPERFQRSDFIAAGLVFVVTLAVYIVTLSPTVTLEDSGELITGAAKFGVPHPPGYPLWTMSGFLLSHLIPVRQRGVAHQSAVGPIRRGGQCRPDAARLSFRPLAAQRWAGGALQPLVRPLVFYVGLFAGCVIGFSDVMWSQGVIAEVYTLNGLFVNLVLLLFYFWMLEPRDAPRLLIAVFVFALGLTNHHTLIQVIPAMSCSRGCPVAALFLPAIARPGMFWSVFSPSTSSASRILVYLSWLSNDVQLHQISDDMAVGYFPHDRGGLLLLHARLPLALFLPGALLASLVFAYAYYFMSVAEDDTDRAFVPPARTSGSAGGYSHAGWLQITSVYGLIAAARSGRRWRSACSSLRSSTGASSSACSSLAGSAWRPTPTSRLPPAPTRR